MTRNNLPISFISPVTGNVLTVQPEDPAIAVAEFSETSTEFVSNVAAYTDQHETEWIYIAVD